MDYLPTVGAIHLLGVILWIGVLTVFSVLLYENIREKNKRIKCPSTITASRSLPAVLFTGSTGFYFLQQWEIWNRIEAM